MLPRQRINSNFGIKVYSFSHFSRSRNARYPPSPIIEYTISPIIEYIIALVPLFHSHFYALRLDAVECQPYDVNALFYVLLDRYSAFSAFSRGLVDHCAYLVAVLCQDV